MKHPYCMTASLVAVSSIVAPVKAVEVSFNAEIEKSTVNSAVGLEFSPSKGQNSAKTPEKSEFLNFDPPEKSQAPAIAPVSTPAVQPVPKAPPVQPVPPANPNLKVAKIPDGWWEMGSNSPLAIALGGAEGTRRPDGGKNPAYYWHTDPGNGANNFGTFSWQHLPPEVMQPVIQAPTVAEKRRIAEELGLPDRSDREGLARLKQFHAQLRQQAMDKGMSLTLRELINGLDLANQAPLAGLNEMGYLDRLKQMRELVDDPDEQVLEARVWSYWHPQRNTWDAPGLGNTYDRIRHDQKRRQAAIDAALAVQASPPPTQPNPQTKPMLSRSSDGLTMAKLMEVRSVPCPLCGI